MATTDKQHFAMKTHKSAHLAEWIVVVMVSLGIILFVAGIFSSGNSILLRWLIITLLPVITIAAWFVTREKRRSAILNFTDAEVMEVNSRHKSALQAVMTHSIIGCDPNGIIKVFNEGAQLMLGYDAEEVIDRTTPIIFHDEQEVAARAVELSVKPGFEVFATAARQKGIDTHEWTYIRKDGSRLPVLLSITARYDEKKQIAGFIGVAMDLRDRKQAEAAIRKNEEEMKRKLDTIFASDMKPEDMELSTIIDKGTLQSLMDSFSSLTGMCTAILDLKGTVIVASGWQEICTRFHRVNSQSCSFCHESDLFLANHIKPGKFVPYHCKNHMWDVVTPLYIGDKYMGNIYTGQFFYEEEIVDEAIFIAQAEKYGFEREKYLEALHRVPRFSHEQINTLMKYLLELTDFISRLSYSNLKLARSVAAYQQAEEKINLQVKFLQQLMDTIPNAVFYKDKDGLYLGCNHIFATELGKRSDEIIGKSVFDLFVKDQAKIFYQDDLDLIQHPAVRHYETKITKNNGSVCDMIMSKAPFFNADGTIAGIIGSSIDITEHKRTEEGLRVEREQLLSIFNSIDEIIYVIDPHNHEVLYVNDAARRTLKENPVGGKCYKALFGVDRPCDFCSNPIILADKTKPYKMEIYNPRLDRDYSVVDRIIKWPDGRDVKFELALDITERKLAEKEKAKLQNELLQAQKMESVGRLAGGVAHDFNNMLQVIHGYTDFCLNQIAADSPMHKSLQEIKAAAQHSSDLTRQLLAFARKQTVSPQVLDLNHTVSCMLKMLQRLIGEGIKLVWKPAPNLWPVKIDPSQVDQILANLSVNARDAIADVGTLSIETGNMVFDEASSDAGKGIIPGEFVMLAVSDTGCGMDRKTIDNLFEPFFTTKELGRGTGLGLSTIFGVVKQNNGFINVYSETGHGSTFKIYLPRSRELPASDTTDIQAAPLRSGSETILVVEDEPAILQLGKMILEDNGYTVITARTPGEALALVENYPDKIHLLITDVVMPEMNGRQLKDQLAAILPQLKVIFMSGYTANVIAHHGIIEEGVDFLQKPFSQSALNAAVRNALDA